MRMRNTEYYELLESQTARIATELGADPEAVRQVLASLPDSVLPRACTDGVRDVLEDLARVPQ